MHIKAARTGLGGLLFKKIDKLECDALKAYGRIQKKEWVDIIIFRSVHIYEIFKNKEKK